MVTFDRGERVYHLTLRRYGTCGDTHSPGTTYVHFDGDPAEKPIPVSNQLLELARKAR